MSKIKNISDKKKLFLYHFLAEVLRLFPEQRTELHWETPFQLLVAVMLSAQTTDRQVNRVTGVFFKKVRTPADILLLSDTEILQGISGVNFAPTKAKNLAKMARILEEKHDGSIPQSWMQLVELPGVGVKTAKIVLHQLYGIPGVGVDTHIHRVLNRVGIVHTKTPQETDKKVEELFSESQKQTAHHSLVLFGRYLCTARKPACKKCFLAHTCPWHQKNPS